ncbi:MAG: glycoside hydrolase family 13 protein [Bacteroidetes bacterium]|nr:glycoside hydrolase family 13 protein [Bacteroidota bacterium]
MKKYFVLTLLFLILFGGLYCQEISLSRIEPPFWWTGLKNPELQLLVCGKNIGQTDVSVYTPEIKLKLVHVMENPDYLFLDLLISENAEPKSFPITFYKEGKKVAEYLFELRGRETGSAARKSFDASDVIYLLMPDRFSNGDAGNDKLQGFLETADRMNPDGRHGGDIKGIQNHLDYIKELGATAIWITPLLENNMKKYSYHGYSTTDYYKIDPRFGTNDDYLTLSYNIHRKGLKLIMDMVLNHCGSQHWWIADPPAKDWLNNWPKFTRTSYRSSTVTDPYVSEADKDKFIRGWFDNSMPDLNQHNPFLANYLIQNSIWWIEFAGLDGIRLDTYPYSYKDFMSRWDRAILAEYPNFNIVGECWLTTPAGISRWQKGAQNRDGYDSNLPSVFDFALYDALRLGFKESDGWSNGISRLYEILSQDFLYSDPSHIVTFADNHDVTRYMESQGEDARKLKMAMAFLLTSRGIPQIYYGTEVLMTTGAKNGDGGKRVDFPGGWPGDSVNCFSPSGRTAVQNEMYDYLHNLLNWRKDKEVIHTGKLTQFIPRDGVYVYFRYNDKETVMIAMNNNENEVKTIERGRYSEFLDKFTHGTDVVTGEAINDLSNIPLQPKTARIIELKK